MVHIVVDLEMNKIAKSYSDVRRIWNQEVIEFGAVALDDEFKEIGTFKQYVKPEYNSVINPNIERLTGITTEMVADSPCFKDAFFDFAEWCISFGEELEMYEWSDSDLLQLLREIELKGIEVPDEYKAVLKTWHDFQREYCDLLGLERQISLTQAIDYAGVDFEGRQHDALMDAENTAYLVALSKDEARFEENMKIVLDALKPKECTSSLGSMFDFSKIVLSL